MADIRISQLTNKATPVGTDEIEIQETSDGNSYKAALSSIVPLVRVPRVLTSTNQTSVTPTTDYDVIDVTSINGSGTFTINNPTGTPTSYQEMLIYIRSATTNALSWGNAFSGGQNALYTALAAANKIHLIHFTWDPNRSKWYQRTRGYEA